MWKASKENQENQENQESKRNSQAAQNLTRSPRLMHLPVKHKSLKLHLPNQRKNKNLLLLPKSHRFRSDDSHLLHLPLDVFSLKLEHLKPCVGDMLHQMARSVSQFEPTPVLMHQQRVAL